MKQSMIEAFGYLRVSGKGQLKGDGFPRQREAIQRYAAAHGISVVRWFEERAVPGATEWESRPAWTGMVQNLNGVRTILVERVDRLARDLGVQEWVMRDLKQRNIELVSATEENLDADPARVLFRQLLGAIAQYDRSMLVLKLKAARKRKKAATGRCEGRKPYGARAGELDVVRRARELRSAGTTYNGIADAFNAEGVPTRYADGRWFGSTVAKILRRS